MLSHVTHHMSFIKCLFWSLRHFEQPDFSCVSSKVIVRHAVTCLMSHFTFHMSHITCHISNAYFVLKTCWTTFVFMCKLKSDFLSCCHMSRVTCDICDMSQVMSHSPPKVTLDILKVSCSYFLQLRVVEFNQYLPVTNSAGTNVNISAIIKSAGTKSAALIALALKIWALKAPALKRRH